jgi:acyl-CoA synthetase (NDP forming)
MLIGMSHDPTWGPIITVGLGGVWVEVLKDVTFLLAPSHPDHIRTALAGLRGYGMLQEVRGRPARDLDALVDFIERFSWLAADLGPRIEELDVNPLAVRARGQGVAMVDALMLLRALQA